MRISKRDQLESRPKPLDRSCTSSLEHHSTRADQLYLCMIPAKTFSRTASCTGHHCYTSYMSHYPFLFALLLPLLLSRPVESTCPSSGCRTCTFAVGEASVSLSSRFAFLASASPTTSILVASHCWNGLATKKPSAVNQVVKGVLICHVLGVEPGLVTVTVR